MAAARLDAALWELHRPLQEAPDGAEPTFAVAPSRLVKEVEECLNVENVEVTLARARLFRNEHPPDLCRWLASSKSFKVLETPRTNVLKEMAKYIKKRGAGPHTLTAFESLRLVLEGRGHATARQAAASALRELFKRDSERVISGEQWRSVSHKCVDSLAGEKAKGVRGEAMKLAASLIASELPAPPLAIDDRSSSPWDEQGASLLRICKLDLQKDTGKDSGSTLAALEHLCGNDAWASQAAEIGAPAILTLLEKYAVPFQKVFTRYEAPAKALRFLRRRASLLAPSLPSEPMATYHPLSFAATIHPDGNKPPPELVAKHASIALFETLHALALQQRGDWSPVFALLEAGCRDVNPKVRSASLRSIAAAAPASSVYYSRLMEAANACADACDAQDNERRDKDLALQGEKDKVLRRLEHWDALQVRSAALHASSSLVTAHQTERPRAALQALAQRARRCVGAHADQCALYGENARARQYLVDGLASLVKACSALKGGRASLRVVCRDAVQVASIQHKRPDEDSTLPPVFRRCAQLWRDVITLSQSDVLYDALLGASLEILQRLDLRYEERMLEDEMRPRNEFDQELLINLASFLETFVNDTGDSFAPWASQLLRVVVDRASKHERCSSLYRLGALAIRAGTQCSLTPGDEDAFLRSARKFTRDTAYRIGDFRDELLECACRVVLSAPLDVRTGQLAILAPALGAALRLGSAHRPTATRAFDAVVTWRDDSSDEFFTDDVLNKVLPEIGRYAVAARSRDVNVVIDKAQSAQARARARRAALAAARADPHVSDSAARYLSRRAVRFLSSCGGEATRAFSQRTEDSRMLGAPLTLSLGTLSLRLDGALLNRLGDIACGSGPRQTRLLASEALHALVLVAIGRTTSHPNQHGKGAQLEDSIYARAWPYVCSLASHSDSIIRALFRELLLQCCRLFSNRDCREQNEKTRAARYLVDALFEALSGHQASKRASAAEALAEFVNWTCKQMRPAEVREEMTGVTGKGFDALAHVLRRVAFDLGQRDATRRLGAALALGKLARHVRAHSLILSRFGLHLLRASLQAVETSSSGGPGAAATRAASAAADRLAEGIRHHVARKRDDAKLMDATVVNRAPPASIEVLCDELMASAAHPDDACRRRTWYTLAKLAPLVAGDLGTFYRQKLPDQVRARSALWPPLPIDCENEASLAKAVACVHAVGSFMRAGVIDHQAVAEWASKGADALAICTQLVSHVGSRQRGSAMIDDDDEVCEERRRILRRDALRHSCDLASQLDEDTVASSGIYDLLRIFVDAVVSPDRRGALPSAQDDVEVRTQLPLSIAKLLKRCPLHLTRKAISTSLQALAPHWSIESEGSEPTHSSSREDTEEARLSTPSRAAQRRRDGALRLYDALYRADALDNAAPSEDVARLLARNFFEGVDDDDDEDDGALRLAVAIGLPLLGEPEAPGLLPLVIKDLKTGEACDRHPEVVYEALVCNGTGTLSEEWSDTAEKLCRAGQAPFVVACGDWARTRGISRAALAAPLLTVNADAWPTSQKLGLATRLLGAGFRGRQKRLEARNQARKCVTDALQGDDDAAADKAIRLVPHFVGGLTRNAPGRRRRTNEGDETDAFDEDDEICIEDDAEILKALDARLARTLPARSEDWASNEFDENSRNRARNDASALGAAYGSCGAPRLLALLSRRIPALKDTLGRSIRRGLRAAAVGASQATYDNDTESSVAFLDDLAAHCGLLGKKAPPNSLNRRSKQWPDVCRFICEYGLVPALKRFDGRTLSVFLRSIRDSNDGVSTRPVISLALTALEKSLEQDASPIEVASGQAAACILEQAFDALPGLGRGGLEENVMDDASSQVLQAYGQDAKALRKRVLRLWVSKLKSVTDVSPRVVKSAYRLAVVLAEASQDNPQHLNKIVLAPERSETLLLALQPEKITLTVGCGFESMTTARGQQRRLSMRRDRIGALRANVVEQNNDDDDAGLSQFARTMLRHSSLGLEASQIDDHEEEDAFAARDDEEDVEDVEAVPAVEASLWDVDAGDPALLEEDTDDEDEDDSEEAIEIVAHPLNRTPLMAPLVSGLAKLARLEAKALVDARNAAKATGASPASVRRKEHAPPKSAEVLASHLDQSEGDTTIYLLALVFNVFVESKGGLRRALRTHAMHLRSSVAQATARALCAEPTQGIDHLLRSACRFLVCTSPDKRNAPPITEEEAPAIAKIAETLCGNVAYAKENDPHFANGPTNPGSDKETTKRNLALCNALLTAYASVLFDGEIFEWTRPVNKLLTPPKDTSGSKTVLAKNLVPRLAGLSLVNAILTLRPNLLPEAPKTLELVVECAKVRHATLYKAAGEVLAAALKATNSEKPQRDCRDTIEDVTDTSKAGSHHRHGRFASLVSRCTLVVPTFLSRRHALRSCRSLAEIVHEGKSAKQTFEMLRALDVGGVSAECFSSNDELLQQLEGILPKALANSERVTPELPLTEEKEDTKTAKPLVQLGALQLLVSRSEALSRNEQLVANIVHGGPASLEALLAASPDVQVRSLGYDLLAALHDVYFPSSSSKNENPTALRVRAALIRGLGDQDGEGMLDAPKDEVVTKEEAPPPPVQETPDEDVVMLERDPNPPPPPEVIDVDAEKEQVVEQRKGVRRRVYDYWRKRLGETAQSRLDGALGEMFIAPDARPHRFAAFLLLASSSSSPSWNQPLCDDLGGDKGGDLQLDLEGKGSSLVNAFSVVENAKSQRCSSLSTQMFGSGPVKATQKDSLYDATQVDEDDPRAQGAISASRCVEPPSLHSNDSWPSHDDVGGFFVDFGAVRTDLTEMLRAGRQVRLQTQLLFAADHVVPPKTTGDVLEDEAQLSRRLAARTVRFAEDTVTKKKKPARQKVVMYRSYAQGELPNVGLSLAEVVRPLMALSLRDGSIAAALFGQLVGTLYAARPLATRRRVVVGLENALRSCEESPTHELGSALHQAHSACIDASEKPEDPSVLVPSTSIASTALASNALEPGVLTIEKARLCSLTGSSTKGPWARKARALPLDTPTRSALASLYAKVDEDINASLDENDGASLLRAGRLREAFAAFEDDKDRQLDAAKALGEWDEVARMASDPVSLALAGALIDDEDVEEKLRVQLKGVETRAELLRKAPAYVAIRLLRDGDSAGAAEAVDAGFEQVAEALASLSQGSELIAKCVADLSILGDVDAVARPPSSGAGERWRTSPRPPADAPCSSWVASLCTRKVLAQNDQALEAVLDLSRLDIASLALNASITDVATQCLRKNAFFSTAPQGADQLKADYTLALARDYCAANEPERCDKVFAVAHRAERDLVRRGALGLEWADARYAGKCSEGDATPVELSNNAAHDLRTAAIEVSSAEAFFAFADLCDEMLRRDRLSKDDDEDEDQPTKKRRQAKEVVCDLARLAGGGSASTATQRCAASAVETYIRATALDASYASRAIPRVLALLGSPHAEACAAAFRAAAEDAPSSSFKDHGDQLVALLSAYGDSSDARAKAICAAVKPIVERLARSSPSSVRDALRFASEKLKDTTLIRAALDACRDDVAEAFVLACEGLHEPEKRLAEGLDVCRKAARNNDLVRTRAAWSRLKKTTLGDAWPLVGTGIGSRNEAFVAEAFVRSLRKKADSLMSLDDHTKIAKGLDGLRADLQKQPRKSVRPTCPLDKYSGWLRDFDGAQSLLHVPGGRVAGFEPSLDVLPSKQVPKKLSVHATDARRLNFLVKGGEDLRNDARVEGLFEAISVTLKTKGCRGIGTALRTYAVAPLSPRVGLVEWVPASPPVKSILLREFGMGDATKGEALWIRAQRSRDALLLGDADKASKAFTKKRLRVKPQEASQALFAARKVLDATSGGLKRHLEKLSSSAEAFLCKRRTYAYSLAATCAAGYVVGLGDRHLDNFLLSGDGALVHIDLGYSFGTGALLPVPELIPFRLTRELEAPLEPVGARRVLTSHLETTFRTLRQPRARAPLLGLLEAFVREPVLDWLRGARHDASLDRDADDVEAGAAATPERRVATARGKLFGANPCHLLNREVAGNPMLETDMAQRARTVVAGLENSARHALRHQSTLSVEDQVRVLVDLATDPASLGRHWCGLTLWV